MLAQYSSVTLRRMRATSTILALASLLASPGLNQTPAAEAPAPKPKLVVAIIVDQFRYDYLTRFRDDYHGGLDQLLTQGADFTNAFYAQVPTVTAVGHSLFLSGAMPAVSGIVGNAWYDHDEKKKRDERMRLEREDGGRTPGRTGPEMHRLRSGFAQAAASHHSGRRTPRRARGI